MNKIKVSLLRLAGGFLMGAGRHAQAGECYKAALRLARDQFGPCHPLIAELFLLLCKTHAARGNHRKCQSIMRRVAVIHCCWNISPPPASPPDDATHV